MKERKEGLSSYNAISFHDYELVDTDLDGGFLLAIRLEGGKTDFHNL